MECYRYVRNVTDLLSDGKTPYERRLFYLVHCLSVTLSLRKIIQESINLERKSYLDCSSDTHCTREEFGRVTYWLQTLRSWKRWTHLKSTRTDSMQKRRYFPRKKENLFFQSLMDESKHLEEIKTSTTHDSVFPFGSMIEYFLFFCQDWTRFHQNSQEVFFDFFRICIVCGSIWEGFIMFAVMKEFENETREIFNAQEILTTKNGETSLHRSKM